MDSSQNATKYGLKPFVVKKQYLFKAQRVSAPRGKISFRYGCIAQTLNRQNEQYGCKRSPQAMRIETIVEWEPVSLQNVEKVIAGDLIYEYRKTDRTLGKIIKFDCSN